MLEAQSQESFLCMNVRSLPFDFLKKIKKIKTLSALELASTSKNCANHVYERNNSFQLN